MSTLQNAIAAAVKATQAARTLRADTEEGFAQNIGVMPHEERRHFHRMIQLTTAINELESGLRILQALDNDPLEAATPAPPFPGGPITYGDFKGSKIAAPAGNYIAPCGAMVKGWRLRFIADTITGKGEWFEDNSEFANPRHADVHSVGGRIILAYAQPAEPLKDATPTPKYAEWAGRVITPPEGYEIVPEGEYPPAEHMRMVFTLDRELKWKIFPMAEPPVSPAASYVSESGVVVIAYARKAVP